MFAIGKMLIKAGKNNMRHIFATKNHGHHCETNLKTGSGHVPQSLFWAVIIAVFLFLPVAGFAETKEIISEGTYNMGEGNTGSVVPYFI